MNYLEKWTSVPLARYFSKSFLHFENHFVQKLRPFFFFSFISKNIQDFFDYLELLQNAATVITKRGSLLDDHFYYKTGQVSLQNAAAFLLQNGARFITKRGRYYKTGQELLRNAAGITKRGNYYKTEQYTLSQSNSINFHFREFENAIEGTIFRDS